MGIAALIFAIAGLAYLAYGVAFTLEHGLHLGTWLSALFAWAVLYQSYALFRAKKGARWSAMFMAVVISLSSAIIAVVVIQPWLPSGLSSIHISLWPMLGVLAGVTVAFALAAVLLAFAKPPRPNPSLNADVPCAALRARTGPPVS
jgi:hypothetical protein